MSHIIYTRPTAPPSLTSSSNALKSLEFPAKLIKINTSTGDLSGSAHFWHNRKRQINTNYTNWNGVPKANHQENTHSEAKFILSAVSVVRESLLLRHTQNNFKWTPSHMLRLWHSLPLVWETHALLYMMYANLTGILKPKIGPPHMPPPARTFSKRSSPSGLHLKLLHSVVASNTGASIPRVDETLGQ